MAITTNNLISRQTVGSAGAATVTFSNIPQTFTDLVLKVSSRSNRSDVNDGFFVYLNGSTSSITAKRLYGNSSSGSVDSGSSVLNDANTATASVFANSEIYIPNYASANYKSFSVDTVTENNSSTNAFVSIVAVLWSNTAAVTSLTLTNETGTAFMEYSTFSLYGISSNTSTQNTSIPLATGGDVITTDGTYWYHAFKYSGTFTPLKALTADCLTIAGGGPGGGASTIGNYGNAGGGGAGGLLYSTSKTFAATTNHTITVGAGGAGFLSYVSAVTGSNSTITGTGFTTLTATGGGGGGSGSSAYLSYNNGVAGGSGGGGSVNTGNSGGAGTSGQGNAGGIGLYAATTYGGGGGGGAGAVGAAATGAKAGDGGVGSSTYTSWGAATLTGELVSSTYYYAGGGGGSGNGTSTQGVGGYGGGARGAANSGPNTPVSATANTGGGGGSLSDGGYNYPSGNGGSGIVVIRYAV